MATVYKRCDSIVAHLPEVGDELDSVARRIESSARTRLAQHRDSGAHKIVVARGKLDRYVILEGPAAVSIEFGFLHRTKKTYVQGLRILRRAVEGMFA